MEAIRGILEANPQCVVIVDEAYADFGTVSVVPLIHEYPNLLVVGTMSKSRSLAGLRIGYALGNADLIAGITCVKDSFNSYPVDRIAQAAGIAAIRDVEYFDEIRHKVMATRDKTTECLRKQGFIVQDSDANFIFAMHPCKSGRELAQGLRERGILVRRFDMPRIAEYLRISIGTDEEMEKLCAICEEILKG
jgi:histidinol-phosphate aminotransferase